MIFYLHYIICKVKIGDMVNEKSAILIKKTKQFFIKTLNTLLTFCDTFFLKIKKTLNNDQELKKRIIFGLIFAFSILIPLLFGNIIYMIVVFAAFCIMSFELLKIVANIETSNNKMFILLRRFGLVYIAVCCLALALIRENQQGLKISLWMFITVWSVDSFAYFFGKKLGKVKLAPDISPNKTYEGAILGTIGGLFVSIIMYKCLSTAQEKSFSLVSFVFFSLIVIILAQLSDLSESYIKRQCGVKNSGEIIPGHGGLLDRFDSFLLVSPFVFLIVWLNGGILF